MRQQEELRGKYILLSERIEREKDGRFSAFCDELGIATFASSEKAASHRLQKAIGLLLNEATKQHEITPLLESRSIRMYSSLGQGSQFMPPIPGTNIMSGPSFSFTGELLHRPYGLSSIKAGGH